MTTTGDLLLRAILEHPEDDDRRIVYADWLEENEQLDRANYIRWSVLETNHIKASNLLAANQQRWFGDQLAQSLWTAGTQWGDVVRWQRGFVAEVSCTSLEFVTHARALFRAHPVERVKLTDCKPATTYGMAEGNNGAVWERLSVYQTRKTWDHVLDNELFDALVLVVGVAAKGSTRLVFPTEATALEALGAACLLLGHWMRDQPPDIPTAPPPYKLATVGTTPPVTVSSDV